MSTRQLETDLKRGSAELLILALLEDGERHGYDLARQIEGRSEGAIAFNVASLYPMLYRLEDRGLIGGRWVERPGQRRRRCYRLTAAGRRMLARQRGLWATFVAGLDRVAGFSRTP
jgi:DNA-binding PadR family transcriptional regulator